MAEGDKAQCNALAAVFGGNPDYCFLVCFFYAMKKVMQAIKPFPSGVASPVLREIYDLSFARTKSEHLVMRYSTFLCWVRIPGLLPFAKYKCGQWLTGPFAVWQAFATPIGLATTSNAAETFNALLKHDYTLRRRLTMISLLRGLSAYCGDQSSSARVFEYGIIPTQTLARRVSELVRARLLGISAGQNLNGSSVGAPSVVRVISLQAPRVKVAPNKRSEEGIAVSAQLGSNYARKEVEREPAEGWAVDVEQQWCPCGYCFVFSTCIHVVFALRATARTDSCGRQILVSRQKWKRGEVVVLDIADRPRNNGPALSYQ